MQNIFAIKLVLFLGGIPFFQNPKPGPQTWVFWGLDPKPAFSRPATGPQSLERWLMLFCTQSRSTIFLKEKSRTFYVWNFSMNRYVSSSGSCSVLCLFYFNKQRSHRAVKILAIDCHLTWHKLKCKKTSDHNHVSRGSSHSERLLGSEREDRVRYHQCLRCEGPRYQGRTLIKSRERLRNPFVSVYLIIINRMTILIAQWAEKKWIYSQFRWRRILCISREQGLRTKSCTR